MTPGRARTMALVVAGAFFMEFLDGTIIATALPAMARDFGQPVVALSIGISAYLLALAVFIPVSGWVADRYGTRDVFTAAIVVFTGASMLCGLCSGLWTFVAARLLQGLGGAMMVPVGRLAVLRVTEKSALVGAIALLTWPALAAPVLGPPVGGFITTYASWRWIFLLNVPLGVAAIALSWALMPNLREDIRRKFDRIGFVLSGLSLSLIMEGMELVSDDAVGWLAAVVLVAGLALGVVAVRHLLRTPQPLLDLQVMQVPTFAVTVTGGTVFRVTIGTVPFLLPLLFQVGFGLDAFHAGMLVLSTFLGNIGMKPFTTWVMRRWGFRTSGIANGIAAALTMAVCAFLTPATPLPLLLVVLFISGLTRSMQFTVLNTLGFVDVPRPRMSGASTLASVAQQMSIGMGVALGAAVLHLVTLRHGGPPMLADFHVVFALMAVLMLAGLPFFFRLPREAGAEVSGHRPA
ncbi:MFS transporter [Acidisphaera sp. L21]|uniref:MFS transporter n=1 Tax=Acidisphaera sp. L21 TaxID=1641851 RepID=UPI00131E4DF8|nr:MFS transporter [Acidisphaera sp. L21]